MDLVSSYQMSLMYVEAQLYQDDRMLNPSTVIAEDQVIVVGIDTYFNNFNRKSRLIDSHRLIVINLIP